MILQITEVIVKANLWDFKFSYWEIHKDGPYL